jgi:hypothetical protein
MKSKSLSTGIRREFLDFSHSGKQMYYVFFQVGQRKHIQNRLCEKLLVKVLIRGEEGDLVHVGDTSSKLHV